MLTDVQARALFDDTWERAKLVAQRRVGFTDCEDVAQTALIAAVLKDTLPPTLEERQAYVAVFVRFGMWHYWRAHYDTDKRRGETVSLSPWMEYENPGDGWNNDTLRDLLTEETAAFHSPDQVEESAVLREEIDGCLNHSGLTDVQRQAILNRMFGQRLDADPLPMLKNVHRARQKMRDRGYGW